MEQTPSGLASTLLAYGPQLAILVWALGALTGYLLPRPKSQPSLRDAHGFFRELWTQLAASCQLFMGILTWLCTLRARPAEPAAAEGGEAEPAAPDSWYVTSRDLAFFQHQAEGGGDCPGAGPWELLMEKEVPSFVKYIAWRRSLPGGKTEYKSLTTCPDATAHEFIDLYFDDDFRPKWDGMVQNHSVAEQGDFSQRQQVVRWKRRFPFGFITDRQYTIARRLFQQGPSLYGITKAIKHPSAAQDNGVVSVDEFYSMWRSRTVECPWGSGKPAVETLLLHQEQLKIPENLARFAVRHGMWGFVKGLCENMPTFIGARRQRASPFAPDPAAFGTGAAPNPPASPVPLLLAGRTARSGMHNSISTGSLCSQLSSDGADAASCQADAPERTSSNASKLRGLATVALAGSLALLIGGGGRSSRGGSTLDVATGVRSPPPRTSLPGGKLGFKDGSKMRRSVSVASALDSRRRQRQMHRFMQDPSVSFDPLTE